MARETRFRTEAMTSRIAQLCACLEAVRPGNPATRMAALRVVPPL